MFFFSGRRRLYYDYDYSYSYGYSSDDSEENDKNKPTSSCCLPTAPVSLRVTCQSGDDYGWFDNNDYLNDNRDEGIIIGGQAHCFSFTEGKVKSETFYICPDGTVDVHGSISIANWGSEMSWNIRPSTFTSISPHSVCHGSGYDDDPNRNLLDRSFTKNNRYRHPLFSQEPISFTCCLAPDTEVRVVVRTARVVLPGLAAFPLKHPESST